MAVHTGGNRLTRPHGSTYGASPMTSWLYTPGNTLADSALHGCTYRASPFCYRSAIEVETSVARVPACPDRRGWKCAWGKTWQETARQSRGTSRDFESEGRGFDPSQAHQPLR